MSIWDDFLDEVHGSVSRRGGPGGSTAARVQITSLKGFDVIGGEAGGPLVGTGRFDARVIGAVVELPDSITLSVNFSSFDRAKGE